MEETNGLKGVIVLLIKITQLIKPSFKKIVLFGFIGGVFGGAVALFSKSEYTSKASIIVESGKGGGIGKYLQLAESFGLGGGGGSGAMLTPDNVQVLLKSKRIVYTALLTDVKIDDFEGKLVNYYLDVFESPMRDSLPEGKIIGTDIFNSSKREEKVLNAVHRKISLGMLEVITSKKNSIIKVNFKSRNENFSHYFGTALVNSLYDYYKKNLIKDEVIVVDLMQQKCDSVYDLLKEKELVLADLNDRSKLTVKSKANIEIMRVSREVQFLNALYMGSVKNLEIAKFSMLQNKKIFKILDESVLPLKAVKKGLITTAVLYSILFGIFSTVIILVLQEFKSARKELEAEGSN